MEISVWCNFIIPTVFETTLPVGPGTPEEQLEVQLPEFLKSTEEYFVSVRVSPISQHISIAVVISRVHLCP